MTENPTPIFPRKRIDGLLCCLDAESSAFGPPAHVELASAGCGQPFPTPYPIRVSAHTSAGPYSSHPRCILSKPQHNHGLPRHSPSLSLPALDFSLIIGGNYRLWSLLWLPSMSPTVLRCGSESPFRPLPLFAMDREAVCFSAVRFLWLVELFCPAALPSGAAEDGGTLSIRAEGRMIGDYDIVEMKAAPFLSLTLSQHLYIWRCSFY